MSSSLWQLLVIDYSTNCQQSNSPTLHVEVWSVTERIIKTLVRRVVCFSH